MDMRVFFIQRKNKTNKVTVQRSNITEMKNLVKSF